MALVSALLVAAGGLVLAVPATASAAHPAWSVRNVPAVANYSIKSLSCSATGCVSIATECGFGCGGLLPATSFYSTTKGATWREGTIPATVGNATAVSCGSATVCIATATKGPLGASSSGAILMTHDGGKTWSVTTEPKYTFLSSACATALDCFALGATKSGYYTSVSLYTLNGGKSWAVGGFPANSYYVESAACSTATMCMAVGETASYKGAALSSSNGGRTWKDVPLSSTIPPVNKATCTALTCIALSGTDVLITKNGGKSWTAHALPTGRTFQGGACISATECFLVGYLLTSPEQAAIDVTGNSGVSWAPQAVPHEDGALVGAGCEPGLCFAGGERVVYSGATPKAEFPLLLGY